MQRNDDFLILPEDIPENDGRSEVKYPPICKLGLTRLDGQLGEGTGFLIDSTTVITAGHCVIGMLSIEVNFPEAGISIDANKFEEFGKIETPHDMGVIMLSKPHNVQQYIIPSYSTLEHPSLAICGYQLNDETCWGMSGSGELRSDGFYYYEMDTREGQSGGPALLNGTLTAIGVHVGFGAGRTRNRAAPLSSDFKNFITIVRAS